MKLRESLLGVLIERAGFRVGRQMASFLVNWMMARAALGLDSMRPEEFAEFWEMSPSQAYRLHQQLREVLGQEWTPDAVCDVIQAQRQCRVDRVRWQVT